MLRSLERLAYLHHRGSERKEEGLVTVTGQAYVMKPLDNACHVGPAGFETGEDMEIL